MRCLFAACVLLFVVGCSIPGLDEIDQKIEGVSDRIESLEEAASRAEQIDPEQLVDLEARISAIEGQLLASGVEVNPEAGLDISEALEAVDDLKTSMDEVRLAIVAQSDSLGTVSSGISSLSEELDGMSAALDSLEDRLGDLEDEVSSLRSSSGSSGSSGGGTGRSGSGGSSGGRTSGGSGGSSGSSR